MASFVPLTELLDTLPRTIGAPFLYCLVEKDGRIVYQHGVGDARPGHPAGPRDLYWLYSATKPVTVTCVMQLVEAGRLSLDAPVGDYLPAWAHPTVKQADGSVAPAKNTLTLRHLLAMTGGLNYDLGPPALARVKELHGSAATTRQIIDALAVEPLDFEPGSHFQYSLCHDVLGAVIEAVSGLSLEEYLQQNICRPLGMTETTFHPTDAHRARMATQYRWDDETKRFYDYGQRNSMWMSDRYEAGGSGLLSSVADYLKFASALANDGLGRNGARILRPESLDEMTKLQLCPAALADFNRKLRPAAFQYGLGVCFVADGAPYGIPSGAFGWDGAGGFYVQIDRANRMVVLYAAQLLHFGPQYKTAHYGVRELSYEGVGLRSKPRV